VAADAYQEWCRDAMLPRFLSYGEQWQQWSRPNDEWLSNDIQIWWPRNRAGQIQLPHVIGDFREVWVPTEAEWLEWLTTAGYNVVASSRPREERYPVTLVPEDGLTVNASGAVSWAHGMALCWALTPEGLRHFARPEEAGDAAR
jgi:hypothetical protein